MSYIRIEGPGMRRRTVMSAGLACLALPAVSAGLTPRLPAPPFVLVLQAECPLAPAFEQGISDPAARRIEVQGDVTSAWQSTLDPLWRQGRVATAGITSAACAFCFEQLAADRGYRIAWRGAHDGDAKLEELLALGRGLRRGLGEQRRWRARLAGGLDGESLPWVSWLMVPRHGMQDELSAQREEFEWRQT